MLGHACLLLRETVLRLVIDHIVHIVVKIVSVVEHIIICGVISPFTRPPLRRHVIIYVVRIIVRWAIVIQLRALTLPLLLFAPSVLACHLFLCVSTTQMIRRTFRNSSLIIRSCIEALLLLLRRERGTVCPPCSTHGTTCLYWGSISGQPASTSISCQIWLTIILYSVCILLVSCLLVRFKRLIFLWGVSLIYKGHLLSLLILL